MTVMLLRPSMTSWYPRPWRMTHCRHSVSLQETSWMCLMLLSLMMIDMPVFYGYSIIYGERIVGNVCYEFGLDMKLLTLQFSTLRTDHNKSDILFFQS